MKSYLICSLFFLFACDKGYKDAPDDGIADGTIRGRLFLFDTLTTNKQYVPLAAKTVTVSYQESTDTLNYLFSTQTDKDGYFIFNNVDESKHYRVHYEERGDSDKIYTGDRFNIKPTIDTLTVNAYLNIQKENGLHYTVVDEAGNAVKGASVCLFLGKTLFQPGKCENSRYSLTTDNYGHAFKFNIPAGIYYTTAYFQTGGATYIANDTIAIASVKEFRRPVIKKAPVTEYIYFICDSQLNPLPYATVCFFSSTFPYNNGDCSNANFSTKSKSDGKLTVTELNELRYYVIGKFQSDTLTLSGRDTINVVSNASVKDTLILK